MMNILSENTNNLNQEEKFDELAPSYDNGSGLDQEIFVSSGLTLQLKKNKFGGYAVKSVNDYVMRLQAEQRQVREQMEKQIEGLLAEKRTVTQECDFLHDRINECESELQSAKSKIKTMFTQEQMEEVKTKLSEAEHSLAQANADLQVLEDIRAERERLEDVCADNAAMIEHLESTYSQSVQEQERLNKEIRVLEVALKGSKEDIAEQIQTLLAENHQLDVDNCDLRQKIDSYDSVVPVSVAEREAFDQSLQELEQERELLRERQEQLDQDQHNIELDIKSINEKIDELEAREAEIKQTEQKLGQREHLMDETERKLSEKEAQLRESENRIDQREKQIQEAVRSLTEKGVNLEKQEAQLQEREIQIQNTENDLAQRVLSVSDQETSLAERQTALEEAQNALALRQTELQQAEALVSEKESQLLSAQNDVAERELAVQQQSDSLIQREAKIQEIENDLNQREEKISQLEGNLNERVSTVQNAEDAVSQREASIQDAENALSEREAKLREDVNALQQREATVQELEDAMSQKLLAFHDSAEANEDDDRQLVESLEELQPIHVANGSGDNISLDLFNRESSAESDVPYEEVSAWNQSQFSDGTVQEPQAVESQNQHAVQSNSPAMDQKSVQENLSSMYDALSQMMESLEKKSANMERMISEQQSLRNENANLYESHNVDRGRISELEAENERLMKELQNVMAARSAKQQPTPATVHVEPAVVLDQQASADENPVEQTPDALARARMILQKMREDLSE